MKMTIRTHSTIRFLFIVLIGLTCKAHAQESSFYEFDVIAQSGGVDGSSNTISSFNSNSVSLNNSGVVAFVATNNLGQSLYIGDGTGPPTIISFAIPSGTRTFHSGVQINNENRVVARDRASGTSLIRIWEGDSPGTSLTVVRGNIDGGSQAFPAAYSSVFSHPSISNAPGAGNDPMVVFSALDIDLSLPDTVLASPSELGETNRFNFFEVQLETPLRPMVADDGSVVVRQGNLTSDPIVVYNAFFSAFETIADLGFSAVGNSPGISDDGVAVAFSAVHADGDQGIWVNIRIDESNRDEIQVAGSGWGDAPIKPELGINDAEDPLYLQTFSADARVGVIHQEFGRPGLLDDALVFTFLATPNEASPATFFTPGLEFSATEGLWSVQVDIVDDMHVELVPGNTHRYRQHPPVPVLQIGTEATALGMAESLGTVVGINVYDPLDSISSLAAPPNLTLTATAADALAAGSHRVAAWLSFSGGETAIIRATMKNSCILPVTRLPQGGGQPWACDRLDTHPSFTACPASTAGSIRSRGCVLTTMTMQLNYSSLINDAPGIKPDGLNDFLLDTGMEFDAGETLDPFTSGAGLIRGSAVALYERYRFEGESSLEWVESGNLVSSTALDEARSELYNQMCGTRAPVATRVTSPSSQTAFGHDVLVTAIGMNEFLIADPAGSCINSCTAATPGLAKKLSDYSGAYKVRGYVQDPPDLSFLSIATSSEIEVWIENSSGSLAGISLGTQFTEISGSTYTEEINGDSEAILPDNFRHQFIFIDQPPAGTYMLHVRGFTDTDFEVKVGSVMPDGSTGSLNETISGNIVTGGEEVFELIYDSSGQLVAVPDVVGLTQAAAEAAITVANLTVGAVSTASSDTVPAGDVISQNPIAGTDVTEGSAVDLVVSLGPANIPAPDVVGQSQAAAEAAIIAANLIVGDVTTTNSDTVPVSDVISQDPLAGTNVAAGSAVDLVVSLGPALIPVPDVVGQSQASAEAEIIAANLIVGIVSTANSDTVPAGDVISQNPIAGTDVANGSAVDLVVSLGPALVQVPAIVGLAQAAAQAAITGAGLAVGDVTTAYSDSVPAQVVISQNPAPGTEVVSDSAVDFVVSLGPDPNNTDKVFEDGFEEF